MGKLCLVASGADYPRLISQMFSLCHKCPEWEFTLAADFFMIALWLLQRKNKAVRMHSSFLPLLV